MMLLASLPTKFLTHVGHFGDHSRNQRRFAPTLPHFTGIGAPLQRNPHPAKQVVKFAPWIIEKKDLLRPEVQQQVKAARRGGHRLPQIVLGQGQLSLE
jgi:hypothetical protein